MLDRRAFLQARVEELEKENRDLRRENQRLQEWIAEFLRHGGPHELNQVPDTSIP
jgi:FtsZ-binding cell division protein ZapB